MSSAGDTWDKDHGRRDTTEDTESEHKLVGSLRFIDVD